MLCCVGLIGGLAVGQSLGGPWTYIAPAAGFGIGLLADMKFMKGMHGKGGSHDTGVRARSDVEPVPPLQGDHFEAPHQVHDMAKN